MSERQVGEGERHRAIADTVILRLPLRDVSQALHEELYNRLAPGISDELKAEVQKTLGRSPQRVAAMVKELMEPILSGAIGFLTDVRGAKSFIRSRLVEMALLLESGVKKAMAEAQERLEAALSNRDDESIKRAVEACVSALEQAIDSCLALLECSSILLTVVKCNAPPEHRPPLFNEVIEGFAVVGRR